MPSETPRFSILVPSIPSRIQDRLIPLLQRLNDMASDKPVEVISCIDNKRRSIGLKRDALVQIARGDYLAFVDDDDEISDEYVDAILNAAESNPDVICFKQWVTINDGNRFSVDFSIEYENEEAKQNDDGTWIDIRRQPFHVCAWRRELAQKYRFPDASYGEDWHWAKRVLEEVSSEARIDKHLHFYKYSDRVTEAALDFAKD